MSRKRESQVLTEAMQGAKGTSQCASWKSWKPGVARPQKERKQIQKGPPYVHSKSKTKKYHTNNTSTAVVLNQELFYLFCHAGNTCHCLATFLVVKVREGRASCSAQEARRKGLQALPGMFSPLLVGILPSFFSPAVTLPLPTSFLSMKLCIPHPWHST